MTPAQEMRTAAAKLHRDAAMAHLDAARAWELSASPALVTFDPDFAVTSTQFALDRSAECTKNAA